MKEQLVAFITHWLESTTLPRKAADILAVFVIALLGGGLYSAWNAEADIRRLALRALEKTPEIDVQRAGKLSQSLLADVQKAGGVAVACFRVDLSANVTQLVFYVGPDDVKTKFPRLKAGFDKVPFIFAGMGEAQQQIASSMMTGNPETVYYDVGSITLVAVPIPDKAASFLAGFVLAAIPGKHGDNDPEVINMRLILSQFSNNVL